MKDQVMEAIETIEKLYERRGTRPDWVSPRVSRNFDKMTKGLHPAEMVVIAARPAWARRRFAMNIAEHVAVVTPNIRWPSSAWK